MGYAVLHLSKVSGSDSAMSSHIERTIAPKNADPSRTHLNRELIEFPEGVQNRTQAIEYRLYTAGLKRKIGTNQVRAIRIMLSGSNEDMKGIDADGNIGRWCDDNLDWLKKTFKAENLVSAVLHLDESTPHIHATVIPIVTGERRKVKNKDEAKNKAQTPKAEEQQTDKKQYRKKSTTAPRLCADDVMARDKLKLYQDTYAEAMKKYGLQRGIVGSEAKHITTGQFYRDVIENQKNLQENITALSEIEESKHQSIEELEQQEQEARVRYEQANTIRRQKESELRETEKTLDQVKGQLKTEKFKNTAAEVGSTIIDGIGSMIGTPKVKKQQQEIESLKSDKEILSREVKGLKLEIQAIQKGHETVIDKLKQELGKIYGLFPQIKELLRIENLCKVLHFPENLTKQMLEMKPVGFKGKIYSPEYERHFETAYSVAEIKPHQTEPGKLRLTIDGVSDTNWFRQKYREFQQAIGINIKPKPKQNQGIGM